MVTNSNTISLHQVSMVTGVRLSGTTGKTWYIGERKRGERLAILHTVYTDLLQLPSQLC